MSKKINIIGGGLAGSEAAWQCAQAGLDVHLYEMRPKKPTFAHQTGYCAELVCSNSFRSDDAVYNAVGLLHEEMRRCGSLILAKADAHSVPAGGALAVDRDYFAKAVTEALSDHPHITIHHEEIVDIFAFGDEPTLIATGPLTSDALSQSIQKFTGMESLAFFDAIAPIVYKESIDFEKAWFQSRYDKHSASGGAKDYINCPMTKEQYEAFIDALCEGEKTEFKDWEKDTPYFEGCLPIEVMASRGRETLRYGPMKPVGLTNPHSEEKPYAVVQLRQDNALGTLYNLVGFQTKLKYGAQKDIFQKIPGLEKAEFARLGGIHRNTFIKSPLLLDQYMRFAKAPQLFCAGQITGVEGYLESAAMGLMVGRIISQMTNGELISLPPRTTALGALHAHITEEANAETFQPMNVNFGLFPPPPLNEKGRKYRGKERKEQYTKRALKDLENWLNAQELEKSAA